MSKIKYRIFIHLRRRTDHGAGLQIITRSNISVKADLPSHRNPVLFPNLIKMGIYVVDNQRRSTGKIHMCPCVCKHMHGNPDCLQALSPGKLHRFFHQISVGAADQAVFTAIHLASLYRSKEISGQKMK